MGLDKFIKASPQDPPLMEVQVKGLSQVHKQFLGRRASLWTKLGKTKPVKEISLTDTRAMVCTAGMDALSALGLQKDMLAKTKMVVRGFKRSMLTVLGAVAVEISAGGRIACQMLYVTRETRQLVQSCTCLEQLGMVFEEFHIKGVRGDVLEGWGRG